jgi:hypothetical protein
VFASLASGSLLNQRSTDLANGADEVAVYLRQVTRSTRRGCRPRIPSISSSRHGISAIPRFRTGLLSSGYWGPQVGFWAWLGTLGALPRLQ